MTLKTTVADRNGGYHVDLTEEQENIVRKDWKESHELKTIQLQEIERKKSVRDQARGKLFELVTFSDEEKALLFK